MSYEEKNLSFNSYLVSAKFGWLVIFLYLCGCKIIKKSALNKIINQKKLQENETEIFVSLFNVNFDIIVD